MKPSLQLLLVATLSSLATAQIHDKTTQNVWALDKGNTTSPTPVIRVYSPSGAELTTYAVPGSGSARALAFDRVGNAYVCRGNAVYQLDPAGVSTGVTFAPPAGASNAMDVVESAQGDILVAWGTTAASSAITTYDTAGMQTANFTDPGLDHPRRITPRLEPTGTTIYIANRGGDQIVAFDTAAAPPVLIQITDLTTQNVGPIGLCYDNRADGLWVVGDYGQATDIGCIDLSTNTWDTALNYPPAGASGLTSPADISYDRFNRLYVAGRDKDMGTAGVYVFSVPSNMTLAPTWVATWPRTGTAPASIIDVEPQPVDVAICTPVEAAVGGDQNVLVIGVNNRVTFSSASTPSAPFAAALSARWTASACGSTFVQGSSMAISSPDVRGIPLLNDDYFWGSVAVLVPGPSPVPPQVGTGNLVPFGVSITGFLGDLDAAGSEDAFIDLTTLAPAMDGFELSLTFVTFDLSEPALFGIIAQPACIVLRDQALVGPVTICP